MVNLSNHPVEKWTTEQKDAAATHIIDEPFPNVSPTATKEDIYDLARQYIRNVVNIFKDMDAETPNAEHTHIVHVVGEPTFVTAFVCASRGHDWKCVAATTERMSVENPDGTKMVKFRFVQFREY